MSEPAAPSTATADDPQDNPRDLGAWSALDPCTPRERAFVLRVLRGESLVDAAEYAGSSGEDGAARMLGRPRVRKALETIAPLYIPIDPKRVARILSGYWGEKLIRTAIDGSDAQATTAAKELVSLAGIGATSRVEHIHASLADVLGALDRRISDKLGPAPEPKRLESGKPASDTESVGPTTLDAIWDPVLPSPAQGAAKPEPSPAPKAKAPKRGPGRRRKTPAPSR